MVALIFGLINAVLKPIVKTVGCAFYVLTLGLVGLVVNGLLLWLTSYLAGKLKLPFHITGFWPAFLGRDHRGPRGLAARHPDQRSRRESGRLAGQFTRMTHGVRAGCLGLRVNPGGQVTLRAGYSATGRYSSGRRSAITSLCVLTCLFLARARSQEATRTAGSSDVTGPASG